MANLDDARRRVSQLHADLEKLVARDPDQEVWDAVFPVLDAVLQVVRQAVPNDPVIASIRDFVSPDSIAEDRQHRAVEVLLVVGQVKAAIPDTVPVVHRQSRPSWLTEKF